MLKTFLAGAAGMALVLLTGAPVGAADVFTNGNGSLKDQAIAPQAEVVNWTGFYIGGAIGYGNANHDLSVQEYFKNFCYDGNAAELNAFDDYNHGRPAREWTLDAKNEFFSQSAASCETLDIDGNGTKFAAGDYTTIPGDSREIARLDGMNTDGLVGDVRIGYDQAMGRIVAGVFASYGFSNMEGNASLNLGGFGANASLEKGDEWSIGARLGYIVAPRTMAYILAAYTQTDYDFKVDAGGKNLISTSTDFDGLTVGGGIEFALARGIFFGVEGTHTFYGEETLFDTYDPATNVGTKINDDLGETRVMGTLKIKLNGSSLID